MPCKWKKYLKIKIFSFPNGFWSHPTKLVKFMFSRFWGVLCQAAHLESNSRHFWSFSLFGSALWFLLETLFWNYIWYLRIKFCSFSDGSWNQPTKFGKLIFSGFWGVLCQTAHPESNLKQFWSFSLFGSPLWFLLKNCFLLT